MGKRARRRNREPRPTQFESWQQSGEPSSRLWSRRNVLTTAGITATSGLVYLVLRPFLEEEQWHLLDDQYEFPENGGSALIQNTVNLREESELERIQAEYRQALEFYQKAIQETLFANGWSGSDVSLVVRRAHRAVPLNPRHAQGMLEYCIRAEEFLHESIDGLVDDPVDWRVLQDGDNYQDTFDKKGFLGEKYIRVYEIDVVHQPTGSTKTISSALYGEGSHGHLQNIPGTLNLGQWYVFIGRDKYLINAPFSEIIPISTYEAGFEFLLQGQSDMRPKATEAISEGLSQVLGEKFAEELRIPNSMQILKQIKGDMQGSIFRASNYQYVPAATAWIERNGVQRAFDLYIESPVRFMEEILK